MNFFKTFFIFLLFIFSINVFNAKAIQVDNSFELRFSNAVPDSVKPAVTEATLIWSKYIKNKTPIVINVSWVSIPGTVAAYARATQSFVNIPELPLSNFVYPIALAEHFAGYSLNNDNADIDLAISSEQDWFINVDTIGRNNKIDLVTIIIHEIAHGLGIIGNFEYKDSKIALAGYPYIFDNFLFHKNGISCLDTYNNSNLSQDSVKSFFTSNELVWKGQYSKSILGRYPEIFSPSSFNSGSSLYHIDEDTFIDTDTNSLMTPFIGDLLLRDPGLLTVSLLADIGWDIYFISDYNHENISDVNSQVDFNVSFNTDLIDTSFVELYYSYDNGKNFQLADIDHNFSLNDFSCSLPQLNFERDVFYYYKTRSLLSDTITFPSYYYKSFSIGEDLIAPVINHSDITFIPITSDTLTFLINVIDDFAVDSSYAKIIIGRNNFSTIIENTEITFSSNIFNSYVKLPLEQYSLAEGDQIAYNIFSVDKAGNTASILSSGNYNIITIQPNQDPLLFYITDFEDDSIIDDFYFDKFTIDLVDGFSSYALHTPHPYVSSYVDLNYVQYTAQLKQPIIISNSPAIIEFDQIVLVEPGRTGVNYGEFGFWDYVVVEGTKDPSNSEWLPIGKKGYDSNLELEWTELFYSSITSENNNSSTAIATEDDYVHFSLNLLENKNFRVSDTIFIRFRLQSDYSKHGWGWAIDNLKIQEQLALKDSKIVNGLTIYPNPCKDFICIDSDFTTYTISNLIGQEQITGNNNSNVVNTAFLASGIYTISIFKDGEVKQSLFVKE